MMNTQHALIVGGSMAGLLAARVLANRFSRVTLVERDIFPDGPQQRKGLPQARHVHVLLWRGQQVLEGLFPGFQNDLSQGGAPSVDWINDAGWFTFGKWAPRFQSKYISHPCSRDLLEWQVRQRVAELSQVQFCTENEVIGLLVNSDGQRVTGVRIRQRGLPDQEEQILAADLVVDASGRDSNTPQWLEANGFEGPEETIVNSFLGYASRVYRQPDHKNGWKSLLVRGTPPENKRGGVINPIENGRWMVTLAGAGKDYPPTDEAGFLAYAQSLPVPDLYHAIKDAEPLSTISGYRKTENRWRHYEGMARWPDNFIVLGDAACGFNPVYGQGMTAAALYAEELSRSLGSLRNGSIPTGWTKQIQARFARAVSGAWLLAIGDDYRYPETEGRRTDWLTRLTQGYMDRVLHLANDDRQVFETFFSVIHLLNPASSFFNPAIMLKVLRKSIV